MKTIESVTVSRDTQALPVMKVNLHIPRDKLKMFCDMFVVAAPLYIAFIPTLLVCWETLTASSPYLSSFSLLYRLKAGSFLTEQDCEHFMTVSV